MSSWNKDEEYIDKCFKQNVIVNSWKNTPMFAMTCTPEMSSAMSKLREQKKLLREKKIGYIGDNEYVPPHLYLKASELSLLQEEEDMRIKISWLNDKKTKLNYKDLDFNESFVFTGDKTVYRKVNVLYNSVYAKMDESTGLVHVISDDETNMSVTRVETEINCKLVD